MRLPRWICCIGFAASCILAPPTAFPQADSSQSCIPIVKELQFEIVRKNMPFTGTLTVTCEVAHPDGTSPGERSLFFCGATPRAEPAARTALPSFREPKYTELR